MVGIEERAAEQLRHGAPDRRLAGAHEANEEKVVPGGVLVQDRAPQATDTNER
jgi:hypothetical protein